MASLYYNASTKTFEKTDRRMQQALGIWISSRHCWTHFTTLTFKTNLSHQTADRCMKQWLRKIAKVCRKHIPIFLCAERTNAGRLHLHLILELPSSISTQQLSTWWFQSGGGGSKHVRYAHAGEHARYMVKGTGWKEPNLACHRPPKCRRRGICREAPFAW